MGRLSGAGSRGGASAGRRPK